MAAGAGKLTDRKCKNAARQTFRRGGLFLHVTEAGRYWRQMYRFEGREKLLSPEISLANSRERRAEARKFLQDGRDQYQENTILARLLLKSGCR